MRSLRSEPFLWIHLAGIAAVPIFLEVCILGLAVGDPLLPVWLELLLVAGIGVVPALMMQLLRPFYIFSVLIVAVKPEQLTAEQRRLLYWFKQPEIKVLAIAGSILLLAILWFLYQLAPLAAPVAVFAPQWRVGGLVVAALALAASNLFLQVPLSVARVMLVSGSTLAQTEPYPLEKIRQDFTIPGLQINQVLPTIEPTTVAVDVVGQAKTTESSTSPSDLNQSQ